MKQKLILFIILFISASKLTIAQYTHADTLRGTNGIGRKWWNITYYNLIVEPNIANQTINGNIEITFNANYNKEPLQLDLQEPMQIDSIFFKNEFIKNQRNLKLNKEGNLYWITGFEKMAIQNNILKIYYSGKPRIAKNAPWDGGLIWKTDKNNYPFVSVACQGLGASVWYPCKDYQGDEPDSGAQMTIITPDSLQAIGNGRLVYKNKNNKKIYNTWQIINPINNYNFVFYIGNLTPIKKIYKGINGKLDCTFWVLKGNEQKAENSYSDIFKMLKSFEKWFGPYPWYSDGYQFVEAPHLGMEHQSAIAYGNKFKKGYLGMDLSGSGYGKNWDYIIVHESGHEWWGNHITTNDIADMWIHEGFTTFAEGLFVEEQYGKQAGIEYIKGLRKNILNKEPIIGDYGVNKEPNGDIYYKGANILLMIRTMMNDDEKFKNMLMTIQNNYGKTTCNSIDIENFITTFSGINFKPFFQQYLYTNQIPVLKKNIVSNQFIELQLIECNDDFEILYPVPISEKEYKFVTLKANQKIKIPITINKKTVEKKLKTEYYLF